jgi:hypothetical protein
MNDKLPTVILVAGDVEPDGGQGVLQVVLVKSGIEHRQTIVFIMDIVDTALNNVKLCYRTQPTSIPGYQGYERKNNIPFSTPQISTSITSTHLNITPPIGDSGATDTLVRMADIDLLKNISYGSSFTAELPNGDIIASVGLGELPLDKNLCSLPAHIFNDKDLNRSLISIADICDSGCTVQLTATGLTIFNNEEIIYNSKKLPSERLWPMPTSFQNSKNTNDSKAYNIIQHKNNADFVAFHHAALGSPTVSTLI